MTALTIIAALAMSFQGANGWGFVASRFALELDSKAAGWASSVSGGFPGYEVVSSVGSDGIIHKHIGNFEWGDFALKTGTGMSKSFYQWMKASFDGKYARKDGSVLAADYNFKAVTRRAFTGALVSEVDFPALDAASKDAAKMTIKFQPESVQMSKEPGKLEFPNLKATNGWTQSDFSVTLPDFPDVQVDEVSRIKVKFFWDRAAQAFVGEEVAKIGMKVHLNGSAALDTFLQESLKGSGKTTSATIQYLTSDGTITLTLSGMGISSLNPELDDHFATTGRISCEFYCERADFSFTPAP